MPADNRASIRFPKSFLGRMLLLSLAPTVLILLVIIGYTTLQSYSSKLEANENLLRSIAETVSGEIERVNTRSVVASETMARAQENGLFGNRIASTAYARGVLEAFPEFTGTCFCYEPNADQDDLAYLDSDKGRAIEADALDTTGRFLPYWYRGQTEADQDVLYLDNLLDMETSMYYQGNKEQFLASGVSMPMVTEPYVYEGKMIMEYTYPIVIDGEFKGVACIDRSLNAILDFVQEIKDRQDVDIFIISRLGNFISATSENQDELVTRAIADTNYKDLFGSYYSLKDPDLLELAEDPSDQRMYYFGNSQVETGEWTVIVRKSEDAVLTPIRNEVFSQLGFALVGLIAIAFLSIKTASSMSRRIGKASRAADSLASGGLSDDVDLDRGIDDEIGRMNESFNRVMDRFRELTDVCVSISEGDFSKRVEVKSDRDILSEAINAMSVKRKQAEEDLLSAQKKAETANEAKSVFISSMSHEIRTPLNAIMGYSQILERSHGLSQQQQNDIIAIHRSGKHLLNIVNDILDFSKIEAGKMDVHVSVFDLDSMIQDLFVIFTMRCQEKGIQLKVEAVNEKLSVLGDSVKLRQILVNLIGNAVKFTESGTVTVSVETLGNDHYLFSVTDTGQGIPLEKQQNIFKAFQQDEEGIKQGGTGLGLSISKTLLQLMGSDLQMESKPGEGSRFFFEVHLPAEIDVKQDDDNAYRKVSRLAPGQTIRALLIDDVQANLDVLGRVLDEIGIEIVAVNNGADGLALIDDFRPDIVFSDYHMQGVDGLEVTRRIKDEHCDRDIKVVMISASVFEHHQQMYTKEGVDGFVGKPFVREEIYEILDRLLDVNFVYTDEIDRRPREKRSLGLDISSVVLPNQLLSSIQSASKSGQVTIINEILDTLETEKLLAENLLQHLRNLAEDLDLDGIHDIVGKMRPSET